MELVTVLEVLSALPADYCQLGLISTSSGVGFGDGWKRDKWLNGKALIRKARAAAPIHYGQLGKMAVVQASTERKHSGTFDPNRSGQCGLQHLHRILALVEGGDGINVEIHAQPVAELIGD